MELKDILPIVVAVAALVAGIIQFIKNRKLQRKNQELQEKMHAYQVRRKKGEKREPAKISPPVKFRLKKNKTWIIMFLR